ncbi:phosphotriesterase family protein [Microbacterium sp. CPCC 204701]|uniref:phosphotriesterase family protein n=1 Tax=Microbacterium sp. CPCC 204701 TaxID=2493084 RepID=UPI000FDA45E1|nr:phosphotriesterase-related protein [Microbacterium sp. CPCC 204701]
MTAVSTLTGTIDSSALGRVLVHEHLFVLNEEYRYNYRPDFVEEDMIETAVEQLAELKAAGIDTIMDPTVLGLGRFIHRMKAVADRVELNIIPATGIYTYRDVPFPFTYVGPGLGYDVDRAPGQPADFMVDHFVNDLTVGIAGTDIRASFLKCAIDTHGLTPDIERILRAVAQAHLATGAPVTVHTDSHSRSGLLAQDVLEAEGVDLPRVIIGHSGDTKDVDYLRAVADRGSILGMDRFGHGGEEFGGFTFGDRINTIVALVEEGYSDRITLSHDNFVFADFYPPGEPRNRLEKDLTFLVVSQQAVPALLDRGVTQAQVDEMLIHNPRRYFER